MIEAQNVSKIYGSFVALDRVSFSVPRGEVVGFLGQNGAGKTTTLRILACYMPPTEGSVRIADRDTVRDSDAVRRMIGYLPERVPLYDDLRVLEYLDFRARLKGLRGAEAKHAVATVLDRLALTARKSSLIGSLSKGLRQRVGIADALVHRPALLILDEPTSGLDPDQRMELRKLIKELGALHTVMVSTHILPEAEAICDRIIVIHRGRIRAASRLEDLRRGVGQTSIVHGGQPLAHYGESSAAAAMEPGGDTTRVLIPDAAATPRVVERLVREGRPVYSVQSEVPSLEQMFAAITTRSEDVA